MEQYTAVMSAMIILETARREHVLLGPNNPAWVMLVHAEQHLGAQAKLILRGE